MEGQYFTRDLPLTNVSQAYRPDPTQFIASQMLPMVMVPKKTFNIYYYGKENLKKAADDTRTRFGETKIAEMSISSKPFGPLRGHELMDGIDFDQDHMEEAPLDLEIDITNFLNDQMALTREKAAVALLSDTSVLTQNATPSAAWDDYLSNPTGYTSDPFKDLQNAAQNLRKYGLRPGNSLTMSYYVFSVLQQHPALIERVKYSNVASLTAEMMQNLFGQFGIQKIMVSGAVEDTAGEGLDANNQFIWGNNAWLSYITPNPGLRQVNGGYSFTLQDGKYVDSWFDQKRKTKWIRNNDYYVQQIVGPEAFFVLSNVVS